MYNLLEKIERKSAKPNSENKTKGLKDLNFKDLGYVAAIVKDVIDDSKTSVRLNEMERRIAALEQEVFNG